MSRRLGGAETNATETATTVSALAERSSSYSTSDFVKSDKIGISNGSNTSSSSSSSSSSIAGTSTGGTKKVMLDISTIYRGVALGATSIFVGVMGASLTFPFLQSERDRLECGALCYG